MDSLTFFNPYLQHNKKKIQRPTNVGYLQLIPKGIMQDGECGFISNYTSDEPRMFYDNKQYILNDNMTWPTKARYKEEINLTTPLRVHIYDVVDYTTNINEIDQIPHRYRRYVLPSGTIIKCFGQIENKGSLCLNVFGQNQYFYCQCESEEKLREYVKTVSMGNAEFQYCSFSLDRVDKKCLYGYNTQPLDNLFKLSFNNCSFSKKVGAFLSDEGLPVFETNVEYITRYFVDNDFSSFGWYWVKKFVEQLENKTSNMDFELNCLVSDLQLIDEDTWPIYDCLSFDIECLSGDGNFPDADNMYDMIIQIGVVCFNTGDDNVEKHLFTVGNCDTIPGIFIYEFACEYDMLLAFMIFLKIVSPYIITGYNINNFDFKYINTRLVNLYKINPGKFTKLKRGKFYTYTPKESQSSFITKTKVFYTGVIPLDMYNVCTAKLSLANYKLDTVATSCLDKKKDDLSYKQLPKEYASGPKGRKTVGKYCIQDANLVVELFKKFNYHVEAVEVARLAHITTRKVIFDGQQSRIFSCILFESKSYHMIIPDFSKTHDKNITSYQGATVLNPKIGFYADPTVVFDFESLYPSIMMAHNLCYTTYVTNEKELETVPNENVLTVEINGQVHKFVNRDVRESLLGKLLDKWLTKRKMVKRQMAMCEDPKAKLIYDKKQFALKVTCNAIYGITGTSYGVLPCLPIAATVTYLGRSMLVATTDYINTTMQGMDFYKATFGLSDEDFLGEPLITVIYGDTDSMFVIIKNIREEVLLRISPSMADHITQHLFKKPIKLSFEKILNPLMLVCKKRYYGKSGTSMLFKGIEVVRKTSCGFVKKTVLEIIDLLFNDKEVMNGAVELSNMTLETVKQNGVPQGLEKLIKLLCDSRDNLHYNKVDLDMLTLSAVLSRDVSAYKQSNLCHLHVIKKRIMRREELPNVGDRIGYLLVAPPDGAKNTPLYELAEDPTYVKINNIPIHEDKYFDQLLKAVINAISPIFPKDVVKKDKFLLTMLPLKVYIDDSFADMKILL